MKIQDNGRGMTRQAMDDPASIGLLGMRERAELIGGRVTISSRPGKGTAILITVPVTSPERHDEA